MSHSSGATSKATGASGTWPPRPAPLSRRCRVHSVRCFTVFQGSLNLKRLAQIFHHIFNFFIENTLTIFVITADPCMSFYFVLSLNRPIQLMIYFFSDQCFCCFCIESITCESASFLNVRKFLHHYQAPVHFPQDIKREYHLVGKKYIYNDGRYQ